MKKTHWILIAIVLLGFIIALPHIPQNQNLIKATGNAKNFLAGVFFIDSITESELKQDYALAQKGQEKIKILIVPGHDKKTWGTQFRWLKEANLNAELGEKLYNLFRKEKEFEAYLVRGKSNYSPEFLSYFNKGKEDIKQFKLKYKKIMDDYIRKGLVTDEEWVVHNNAPTDAAIKLYGINKWANENDIDAVLHIHFNDYPRRSFAGRGVYSGFSIYVPEKQLSNSKASIALAKPIFNQLKKYFAVSDLPKEKKGIIEDQKLIAIGSYNTLDAAALLMEYGYIYERQFTNSAIRPLVLQKLAEQTFLGIKNFFNGKTNDKEDADNKLAYQWKTDLERGLKGNKEVFFLQTALSAGGLYPPKNLSKNTCPVNGNFGYCTASAVKEFQRLYEIEPVLGYVGPLTRAKLNELYAPISEHY